MKQIKRIGVLRKLRNGEHYQIHSVVLKSLETPIADFSELTNAYATYRQVFNHEDVVFKHRSKMLGTQAIIVADEKRDKEFMNLRMIIKSNLNSIDPEIRAAAELLMPIVDNYKEIPHKSYQEATAFVTNFIQECKTTTYQAAVTKLGLGTSVDQLEEDNLAFESLYNTRTRWLEQQRLQGNMKDARLPVDEAFKSLVFNINSLYGANEIGAQDADRRTKLAAIIDEVNAQLDNMARTIAYRQPGGGTAPDPDPDPEPEPIVPYRFTAQRTMLVNGRTLLVEPTDLEEFAASIDVRMIGGIMDYHPEGRPNRFTLSEISYDDETGLLPLSLLFLPTDDQDLLGTLSNETYTVEVLKEGVVVLTIDELKEPEGMA